MRVLEPLKYFAGSLVIYYVMAACSAAPSSSSPTSANGAGGSNGGTATGGASSSGSASPGGTAGGGSGSGSGGATGGSNSSGGSPVPDANADETQSGSRLKANYYVGGDGSKQFAYFTDTSRGGVECTFEHASDGSIRCMPSGAYVIATEYADSSCSQPVAESTTCSSIQYAVASEAGSGCDYETHVYAAGAAISTLYVSSGTSCVATSVPAGYKYVAVGAEIAPSSFQVATVQAE